MANDKKFEESLVALRSTMTEVEDQIGENTNFHLFLYQKIASLQILLYDLEGVEESFKKCTFQLPRTIIKIIFVHKSKKKPLGL